MVNIMASSVWCGVVYQGMVWYCTLWYSIVFYGVVCYSKVWPGQEELEAWPGGLGWNTVQ